MYYIVSNVNCDFIVLQNVQTQSSHFSEAKMSDLFCPLLCCFESNPTIFKSYFICMMFESIQFSKRQHKIVGSLNRQHVLVRNDRDAVAYFKGLLQHGSQLDKK
ncbi:Protein of unknown function [Gryllus bimaculatus]|nr:Protein of unknown function [Gryllus bimaculatus]